MTDTFHYRLALVHPRTRQVLAVDELGHLRLPTIEIPRWTRHAEQITQTIYERWSIRTIVLDTLGSAVHEIPCVVAEVRSPEQSLSLSKFAPLSRGEIPTSVLPQDEQLVLCSILEEENRSLGPFGRLGWIDDAMAWIQSSAVNRDIDFTEDWQQFNGSAHFALVRFSTMREPAYWLKAVGKPNTHEYAITTNLAAWWPDYLPTLVCCRSDWNAWVTEEFGKPLYDCFSLCNFSRAVQRLAELQQRTIGKEAELLSVGCADHRPDILQAQVDPIVERLQYAMEKQTNTSVPRLSASCLTSLGEELKRVCVDMEALRIPPTVGHDDISPGSILSNDDKCVFTDWCDVRLANPFITFQQLCLHVSRGGSDARSWCAELKEVYKRMWLRVLSESQIESALTLAPSVSILATLYGRGDLLNQDYLPTQWLESHLRSMARHLQREINTLRGWRTLCR